MKPCFVNNRSIPLLGLLLCLTLLGACGEDLLDEGPSIDSVTITPSEIATTQAGMSDEFFSVTIEISGFTDPIDLEETRIWYTTPSGVEETAQFQEFSANEDETILTFERIVTSWFQDAEARDQPYDIGVQVRTQAGDTGRATESASEVGLAQVTVNE